MVQEGTLIVLTVACVGAGYFSQFHYDAWTRIDGVDLIGAVDNDGAKAAQYSERFGGDPFATTAELFDREKPDILDIVIPPPGHMETIKLALASNVKAIICQKPFCTSLKEAEEAVRLAGEASIPLIVHENFRFQPWFRRIKAEINQGKVGEIYQVTFRLRPGDGRGPNAYLDRQPYFQKMPRLLIHETAVHFIDTFRYLLGEPDRVFADLRRVNPVIAGEDAGYILFSFPDGVRALFDGNRLLDHVAENKRLTMGECEIEGTEGTLALYGDGSVSFRAFGSHTWQSVLESENWQGFAGDCVYALQSHVVDALNGSGAFENLARDYIQNRIIEEAIYDSAESGCYVPV